MFLTLLTVSNSGLTFYQQAQSVGLAAMENMPLKRGQHDLNWARWDSAYRKPWVNSK